MTAPPSKNTIAATPYDTLESISIHISQPVAPAAKTLFLKGVSVPKSVTAISDTTRLPTVLLELYSDPVYKRIFLREYPAGGPEDFPLCHLEEPVFSLCPAVAETAKALRDAGARALLMSGSGATVFAIADDDAEARRLADAMPPGVWTCLTRLAP